MSPEAWKLIALALTGMLGLYMTDQFIETRRNAVAIAYILGVILGTVGATP